MADAVEEIRPNQLARLFGEENSSRFEEKEVHALDRDRIGEIVAVAPDVTARKVGDRLGTAWIQTSS